MRVKKRKERQEERNVEKELCKLHSKAFKIASVDKTTI